MAANVEMNVSACQMPTNEGGEREESGALEGPTSPDAIEHPSETGEVPLLVQPLGDAGAILLRDRLQLRRMRCFGRESEGTGGRVSRSEEVAALAVGDPIPDCTHAGSYRTLLVSE